MRFWSWFQSQHQKRQAQKHFGLIEVCFVVAVIGTIAWLLVPSFIDGITRARH